MFDWYQPEGLERCPSCDQPLDGWQGKDGPCILYVYRQAHRFPVESRVDADSRADDVAFDDADLLPPVFGIYTSCANDHWIDAQGYCDQFRVWNRSELVATRAVRPRRSGR